MAAARAPATVKRYVATQLPDDPSATHRSPSRTGIITVSHALASLVHRAPVCTRIPCHPSTARGALGPPPSIRPSTVTSKPSLLSMTTASLLPTAPGAQSSAQPPRRTWTVDATKEGSSVQTTYYYLRDTAEHVTVIRRHHPLERQSLEVLKGGKHLIVRLRDGSTMRLLRSWSDADGPDVSQPSQPSTVFTIDSLRGLIGLLEALRRRT